MKINKIKLKILLLPLLAFGFMLLASVHVVGAQTMENSMYRIQMGNLNSISGELSGSNYNLSITSGETSPGSYSGTNYIVSAGFQYVPRNILFSFYISNTLIDFGTLSPTNPVLRTTNLIINNSLAKSYKIMAAQDTQLMEKTTGAMIPDTTCDDGSCTQNLASKWNNNLTYGFGYRCDAPQKTSCTVSENDFSNKTFYKQFANTSKKESAVTVMSGGRGIAQSATITYKVNIATSQSSGLYSNEISYIAVPSY